MPCFAGQGSSADNLSIETGETGAMLPSLFFSF